MHSFNNPTPEDFDRFGNSVSVDGDNVLVGAYHEDAGAFNAGSVYLFDATPAIEYTPNLNFAGTDSFDC